MTRVGNNRFRIVLTEGRNRQIRRMCQALGYRVIKLHRTRIMHLSVEGLHVGEWKELTTQEREQLLKAIGRAVR
jgi:23S rRNA pseudouridine2604 synthase